MSYLYIFFFMSTHLGAMYGMCTVHWTFVQNKLIIIIINISETNKIYWPLEVSFHMTLLPV